MSKKILVTYGSFTGSTAGIAEEIGRIIEDEAYSVELLAMKDVRDVSGYDALIIGSAIQKSGWLPESQQFVKKFSGQIRQKPTAMFSVCMTLAMKNGEKYRSSILDWVRPMRSLIQPKEEEVFAGVLKLKLIPNLAERFKFWISAVFGVWKLGDNRDWDKIRAWAEHLNKSLLI